MTRLRTDPNVTLSMNCGAVFRPSLQTGRFIQTRQLAAERFTNKQPWDYEAPPATPPAPVPPRACVQAVEVLDVDV